MSRIFTHRIPHLTYVDIYYKRASHHGSTTASEALQLKAADASYLSTRPMPVQSLFSYKLLLSLLDEPELDWLLLSADGLKDCGVGSAGAAGVETELGVTGVVGASP